MEDFTTQEHEQSVQETRRIICECVSNLLTDLETVSVQLNQSTENASQVHMVLHFLNHCVDAFPQCYIQNGANLIHQNGQAPNLLLKGDEQYRNYLLAKSFSKWVIGRLLRLTSSPLCEPLHGKATSVIIAIIQLIQTRDLPFFKEIIKEFSGLLEDLLVVGKEFLDEQSNPPRVLCTRFQVSGVLSHQCKEELLEFDESLMPTKLIELSDYGHCQLLLKATCLCFAPLVPFVSQYVGELELKLLNLAVTVLQLSDLNLMPSALKLCMLLMQRCTRIPGFLVHKLLWIVSTIVEVAVIEINGSVLMSELVASTTDVMPVLLCHVDLSTDAFMLFVDKLLVAFDALNATTWTAWSHTRQVMLCSALQSVVKIWAEQKLLTHQISEKCVAMCICLLACVGSHEDSKAIVDLAVQVFEFVLSSACDTHKTLQTLVQEKLNAMEAILSADLSASAYLSVMEGYISTLDILLFCLVRFDSFKCVAASLSVEKCAQSLFRNFKIILSNDGGIQSADIISKCMEKTLSCLRCRMQLLCLSSTPAAWLIGHVIEFASIPWLASIDPPWMDFVPEHSSAEALLDLHRRAKSFVNVPVLNRSLEVLCLASKESTCKTWVSHVLQVAMASQEKPVALQAVQLIPCCLHMLGAGSLSIFSEELVPQCRSEDARMQETVVRVVGKMACVLSGQAKLVHDQRNLDLLCVVCKHHNAEHSTASVDPQPFKPYFQMLRPGSSSRVKLAFISILPALLWHLDQGKGSSPLTNSVWNAYMDFICDGDYAVRLSFSSAIQHFVTTADTLGTHQIIVNKMKTAFVQASSINDVKVLETLALTMGSVGKVAQGDLLLVVIISLLECILTQSQVVAAVAFDQVQEVAKAQKMSCHAMFITYNAQICDFIVKKLHQLLKEGKDLSTVNEVMNDVSLLFQFQNSKAFLIASVKEMLPRIVLQAEATSSMLIRQFAKMLEMNRREMLFFNFKYIFSYLVRTTVGRELENSLKYLQAETDVELNSLLLSESQSVFNQLLLYLSVNKEQVFLGLSVLACNDSQGSGATEIRSNKEMAVFLQPKLLGVLAFFNSVLTSRSPVTKKKLALRSLISLMEIMGPAYITPVRLKVMAILKLGLQVQEDEFCELSCAALDCFVHNVDVGSVGPLLGQIVVSLLPLLSTQAEKLARIFTYLIVDNRAALQPYFKDILSLPELPIFKNVNAVLRVSRTQIRTCRDFKAEISTVIHGIHNENTDLKKFALQKLISLLKDHRGLLHELLLRSETVDTVITRLLSALIDCSREVNNELLSLIGDCLGKLTAVDPGRLENVSDHRTDVNRVYQSVDDMEFAVDLLNDLCRAFLAAGDTRAQDCSAFAIQEVLLYYKCTEKKDGSDGYSLWSRFPIQSQELLKPHLYSKYVNSSTYNWAELATPIFGGSRGKTFHAWICSWTSYLIARLEKHNALSVFKPCVSILKHDINSALFIVPHVVLNSILDGLSSAQAIAQEMLVVFKSLTDPDARMDFSCICAQTLFSVLDFLHIWSNTFRPSSALVSVTDSLSSAGTVPSKLENAAAVSAFLGLISKEVLALAAFHCKAFARSLLYYEQYTQVKSGSLQEHLGFLQRVYCALDDSDSIAGVSAVRQGHATLHEQIIEHESAGQLRDAAACYERVMQIEVNDVQHHEGLLRCLIGLGQLNTALMDAGGVVDKRPEWTKHLKPYQAEAAWRLGQWDVLRSNLKNVESYENWSVAVGKLLVSVKDRCSDDFYQHIRFVRSEQSRNLSVASLEFGSYRRSYEAITRLHMLEEIENCASLCFAVAAPNSLQQSKDLIQVWEQRLHATESSFKTREPILNLRRILLQLLPERDSLVCEEDNCWLRNARIARKAGHYHTAYSSLLNVSDSNRADILIEKAQWFSSQGDRHKALLCLQRGVDDVFSSTGASQNGQLNLAKMLLLTARWMDETEYYEAEAVLAQYKQVVERHSNWERGHFYLARYYEKLMNAFDEKDEKDERKMRKLDFVRFVVKHFGCSLQFGSKYIYQSMPSMLTLWLDFGFSAHKALEGGTEVKPGEKAFYKERMKKLNDEVAKFADVLPAYQFLTAFSQLISRICHPNPSVWKLLEGIIANILCTYKQQAIWSMLAVSKSSFRTRSERCHQIFDKAASMKPDLRKFVSHCLDLGDKLLEVCNRRVAKETKLSVEKDFPALQRMVSDPSFSQIVVPLQSTLTATLPAAAVPQQQHNPFPDTLPMICGFEDSVDVLSSLQKPKKIVIRSSNGLRYAVMCKPKDDLRKDARLMEFNSLVNKLLLQDPDCRRRQLRIRTYAVVSLNEECGLIEWVENTTGLRFIINNIHREQGTAVKIPELKKMYEPMAGASVRVKVDIFVNKILPRHPAVFHEWYLSSFPNPTKWYMARLAYARSVAVMSMVGYILGLGDRHGENILLDSTNGECVHVDFNCLFNKGETFDCPEVVPFRLTHNMVKAMGPLGYEGVFRKSCEAAMKLMRSQRDPLLSVLNTFLYDPLVEWKKELRKKVSDTGEVSNEMAVKILKDIENRLKGYPSSTTIQLALSIEGQVHQLIKSATDLENLASMYIGWAAYL